MSAPDARAIARALAEAGHPGVAVHGFDELGSTNAWLAGRGPDASPALCVTDSQTSGSGRRGRTWGSLPGDVTFSLRRRFASGPARLAPLGLVTGVAVAGALRAATSLDVVLKWPNDLLLEGSKLGGLLVESRSGGGRGAGGPVPGCVAVGGIGINLVDAGASRAGATVASLGAHGVGPDRRDALVATVAARTLDAWTRFDEEGWQVFEDDWRALDALEGRRVRVHEGAPRAATGAGGFPGGDVGDGFDGVARGVDPGGALRVEGPDGRVRTVHAADVSVRPRA